jgi:hypothetical protein
MSRVVAVAQPVLRTTCVACPGILALVAFSVPNADAPGATLNSPSATCSTIWASGHNEQRTYNTTVAATSQHIENLR